MQKLHFALLGALACGALSFSVSAASAMPAAPTEILSTAGDIDQAHWTGYRHRHYGYYRGYGPRYGYGWRRHPHYYGHGWRHRHWRRHHHRYY